MRLTHISEARLRGIMPACVSAWKEQSKKRRWGWPLHVVHSQNSMCVCICKVPPCALEKETVCAWVACHVAWCAQQLLPLPLHWLKEVLLRGGRACKRQIWPDTGRKNQKTLAWLRQCLVRLKVGQYKGTGNCRGGYWQSTSWKGVFNEHLKHAQRDTVWPGDQMLSSVLTRAEKWYASSHILR